MTLLFIVAGTVAGILIGAMLMTKLVTWLAEVAGKRGLGW